MVIGQTPQPQEIPMNRTRKAIVTAAAALGVGMGGYGIANATGVAFQEDDEAPVGGSVAVTEDESLSEAEEDAAYRALATVTEEEAKAAATAAVAGEVGEVDLDDEGGSLVYEVEVRAADGTETDVLVDAGDGTVLLTEAEAEAEGDDDEGDDDEGDDDDAGEADDAD